MEKELKQDLIKVLNDSNQELVIHDDCSGYIDISGEKEVRPIIEALCNLITTSQIKMLDRVEEAFTQLSILLTYWQSTRQIGHTTLMLTGVVNEPRGLLLVANQDQKKYLSKSVNKDQMITIHELQELRGVRKPLVVDHFALRVMLNDVLEKLQAEKSILEGKLNENNA
jgi:hypothetical protein